MLLISLNEALLNTNESLGMSWVNLQMWIDSFLSPEKGYYNLFYTIFNSVNKMLKIISCTF